MHPLLGRLRRSDLFNSTGAQRLFAVWRGSGTGHQPEIDLGLDRYTGFRKRGGGRMALFESGQ